MTRFVRFVGVVLVLGLLVAGGGLWWGSQRYDAPGPLSARSNVVVPHGGIAAVAGKLDAAGVIESRLLFRAAALLTSRQGQLHAAELGFPAHASLRQVLDILRHARPVQHELTIPEGLTAAQITALLDHEPLLTGKTVPPPEGTILPQTYAFERGSTRAGLLARMTAAMTQTLDRVWAKRDPALHLDNAEALLILASIVERETGVPGERARVAGVFFNRLRQNIRLQSDPTVAYAITHGTGTMTSLSRADLATDSPYNTYRITGLPPGPICNPGLAALEATAHPAPGPALYFVATGTGGHAFADTLPEHEANVARYRAVMAGRSGADAEASVPSQGLIHTDGDAGAPGGAAPALPPFQPGIVPPAPPSAHRHPHHRH